MKIADPFDLMPISIRRQQFAMVAMKRYSILALTLAGLFGGLVVMRWQERETRRRSIFDLMAQSLPVRDQRLEALKLQQSNEQLGKVLAALASAEPRDTLLQSLAAVTEGVVDFGLTPRQLHLRLAVESADGAAVPVWATAMMQMTVETNDDSVAVRAHEAISNQERFVNVQTKGLSKLGELTRTELVAVPRAEVLLP